MEPERESLAPLKVKPLGYWTAKRRRFVEEYTIDRNATQAYMRAGFTSNRRSAGATAHVLLKEPEIQNAIKEREQQLFEEVRLRQHEVFGEVRHVGTSDVMDYLVDDAGKVTLREGAPAHATKAISSIKRHKVTRKTKDGEIITTLDVTLTLWNKLEALKMALQAEGLLQDQQPGQTDNNYFLTLVQIVQKHGLSSKLGADRFHDKTEQTVSEVIEVKAVHVNGKNGVNGTNGKSGSNGEIT